MEYLKKLYENLKSTVATSKKQIDPSNSERMKKIENYMSCFESDLKDDEDTILDNIVKGKIQSKEFFRSTKKPEIDQNRVNNHQQELSQKLPPIQEKRKALQSVDNLRRKKQKEEKSGTLNEEVKRKISIEKPKTSNQEKSLERIKKYQTVKVEKKLDLDEQLIQEEFNYDYDKVDETLYQTLLKKKETLEKLNQTVIKNLKDIEKIYDKKYKETETIVSHQRSQLEEKKQSNQELQQEIDILMNKANEQKNQDQERKDKAKDDDRNKQNDSKLIRETESKILKEHNVSQTRNEILQDLLVWKSEEENVKNSKKMKEIVENAENEKSEVNIEETEKSREDEPQVENSIEEKKKVKHELQTEVTASIHLKNLKGD